jgi:hypothetical protein
MRLMDIKLWNISLTAAVVIYYCSIPVKTIFECDAEGGCAAVAMTEDARYLAMLSAVPDQVNVYRMV